MENILVPIDFSTASRNAALYATSLGKYFNADVTLINVISPAIIIDDSVLAFAMTTQAELIENNKEMMIKEVDELSKKYPGSVKGLVKEGIVDDFILNMAKDKHTDLIIMGMKGKGKSNSVFGSTTTAIIRKSSFPVLVIPEKSDFVPFDEITLASDFNAEIELNRYALLMEFSEKFNSGIHILNVQKNDKSLSPEQTIGKMKTSLAFSRHHHQFHTIIDNKVEKEIATFLENNPADLLAMVAHSHNYFERIFGKVHTKEMSYQTKIPLLVLQSKKKIAQVA